MLRWMTAGESYGSALLATIEGLPSGLYVTMEDLRRGLACRYPGYGRGARQKFGVDEVSILAGMRHGVTIGAPAAIRIGNSEWPEWEMVTSADPVDPSGLPIDTGTGDEREIARNRSLTRSRPGHADLPGMLPYNLSDARPVLEHVSARETAARVAFGVPAEALLEQAAGVRLVSHVVSAGAQRITTPSTPIPADEAALCEASMCTLDPENNVRFEAAVDAAKQVGDTIGGVAEVIAYDVPTGLRIYVIARECFDACLTATFMSIQFVKGVEIGDGFTQAALLGSVAHDEIVRGKDGYLARASNYAGGIEGGTSNGVPIAVCAVFKPIPIVPHALRNVDLATGEEVVGLRQHSDTCQVVPGAVITEAEMALMLAGTLSDHAGGRSIGEMRRNLEAYPAVAGERA